MAPVSGPDVPAEAKEGRGGETDDEGFNAGGQLGFDSGDSFQTLVVVVVVWRVANN